MNSFNKNVKDWWSNASQRGFLGYIFITNYQELNRQKTVSKEDKRAWLKEIERIDLLESNKNISDLDSSHRTTLKSDLRNEAFREAQYWA